MHGATRVGMMCGSFDAAGRRFVQRNDSCSALFDEFGVQGCGSKVGRTLRQYLAQAYAQARFERCREQPTDSQSGGGGKTGASENVHFGEEAASVQLGCQEQWNAEHERRDELLPESAGRAGNEGGHDGNGEHPWGMPDGGGRGADGGEVGHRREVSAPAFASFCDACGRQAHGGATALGRLPCRDSWIRPGVGLVSRRDGRRLDPQVFPVCRVARLMRPLRIRIVC